MRSFPFTLVLLLAVGLAGCPPRGPGDDDDQANDDDASDDDDSVADDDDQANDDDASDDDDSVADDDDTTPQATCGGGLPLFTELEPNDEPGTANPLSPVPANGFCVEGYVTCGAADNYADMDLFSWSLPQGRDVTVRLEWTSGADFDAYLWDEATYNSGGIAIVDYEDGFGTSKEATGYAPGSTPLLLHVACWDGAAGDYLLRVTYDAVTPGDDDDDDDDDDDIVGTSPYTTVSFATEMNVSPTAEITGTLELTYWFDFWAGSVGCIQRLDYEGIANFGAGLLGADCAACQGLLTLDPSSIIDVSNPSLEPTDCDPSALTAYNANYGAWLTTPSTAGGYGDLLSIALVDSDAMAAANLYVDAGLTQDAAYLESTAAGLGLDFTHFGYVAVLPGSISDILGLPTVASPAGAGSDWYGWWQFTVDPAVNSNTSWVMLGDYEATASWVVNL